MENNEPQVDAHIEEQKVNETQCLALNIYTQK